MYEKIFWQELQHLKKVLNLTINYLIICVSCLSIKAKMFSSFMFSIFPFSLSILRAGIRFFLLNQVENTNYVKDFVNKGISIFSCKKYRIIIITFHEFSFSFHYMLHFMQ